jgi:hypothetical protein
LGGSAAVDVSNIVAVGVDDAFGENRAATEEWHDNNSALHVKYKAAKFDEQVSA